MLLRDVLLLTDIVGQVVELDFEFASRELLPHSFPVVDADSLLASVAVELPIQVFAWRLLLAK